MTDQLTPHPRSTHIYCTVKTQCHHFFRTSGLQAEKVGHLIIFWLKVPARNSRKGIMVLLLLGTSRTSTSGVARNVWAWVWQSVCVHNQACSISGRPGSFYLQHRCFCHLEGTPVVVTWCLAGVHVLVWQPVAFAAFFNAAGLAWGRFFCRTTLQTTLTEAVSLTSIRNNELINCMASLSSDPAGLLAPVSHTHRPLVADACNIAATRVSFFFQAVCSSIPSTNIRLDLSNSS